MTKPSQAQVKKVELKGLVRVSDSDHIESPVPQVKKVELNILDLFSQLSSSEKGVSFLYSGQNDPWSILCWNPESSIVQKSGGDGLKHLSVLLSENRHEPHEFLPFIGGAIGYLSYEAGYSLLGLPSPHAESAIPVMHWNWYSSAVLSNSQTGESFLVSPDVERFETSVNTILNRPPPPRVARPKLNWKPLITKAKYRKDVKTLLRNITNGEIYQACYTYPLRSKTTASGQHLFRYFTTANPAQMSAYFQGQNLEIISLSPERFLTVRNRSVSTCPIKGTCPRGQSSVEDAQQLRDLLASEKETAELMMITDLLRNDLGKVCEIGSVHVEELRSTMKLPTVWHTYSKVTGRLAPNATPVDLIKAAFPGGSITGCPKRRAVQLLRNLESEPRGVYTGSIGYLSLCGTMDLSIAIRTIVQQGQTLTLGVGSGIVADSQVEKEYQETLAKAAAFMVK